MEYRDPKTLIPHSKSLEVYGKEDIDGDLRDSIKSLGVQVPLIIKDDGTIISGCRRWATAIDLDLDKVPVEVNSYLDELEEWRDILSHNIYRIKNLSQRMSEKDLRKDIVAEVNKSKKESTYPKEGQKGFQSDAFQSNATQTFVEHKDRSERETNAVVGEQTGLGSRETVRKAEKIWEKAKTDVKAKELVAKIDAGELTISRAYNDVLRDEAPPPVILEPPVGKYRALTIDPPWEVDKILREVRPNQVVMDYAMMSIDAIKALPIPDLAFDDGCHIYLWTTNKHMRDAFDIFDSWGVKFECMLVWHKNVGFTPFSFMYNAEYVLFGRIGNLPLSQKGKKIVFNADVREHSRKPDEFYNLVREVSPEPRLDMFSREKRDGFEQYGNEVDRFSKE